MIDEKSHPAINETFLNHDANEFFQLAMLAGPGCGVEVEQNFLDRKLIALTAYYGELPRDCWLHFGGKKKRRRKRARKVCRATNELWLHPKEKFEENWTGLYIKTKEKTIASIEGEKRRTVSICWYLLVVRFVEILFGACCLLSRYIFRSCY